MKTKIFGFLAVAIASTAVLFPSCETKELTDVKTSSVLEVKTDDCVAVQMDEITLCFDATKVDPTGSCYAHYDPVCACNMITYPNECFARKSGWTSITPGKCNVKEACRSELLASAIDNLDWNCAAIYQPVCGCDGKTYSNSCVAVGNGVLAFTPGECYKPIQEPVMDILKQIVSAIDIDCYDENHEPELVVACTQDINPVCACGVVEFSNACRAEAAGFENYEEGRCWQNRCQVEEVRQLFRNVDIYCSDVFEPVCGCNGETYQNVCHAVGNGVLAYTPGPCNGIIGDPTGN